MKTFLSIASIAALVGCLFLSTVAFATPTPPTCVVAKSGIAPVATITFTPPTENTDGTPITGTLTYDLFSGTSYDSLALLKSSLTSSPIDINAGLEAGGTYYFDVTAVDSDGTASAPSNVVCITFPGGTPDTVVIKIT